MTSTCHSDVMVTQNKKRNMVTKSTCIVEYNKNMGDVDWKDQILQTFLIERKRMNKWYMKIFKRLLNTVILNAFIIYK